MRRLAAFGRLTTGVRQACARTVFVRIHVPLHRGLTHGCCTGCCRLQAVRTGKHFPFPEPQLEVIRLDQGPADAGRRVTMPTCTGTHWSHSCPTKPTATCHSVLAHMQANDASRLLKHAVPMMQKRDLGGAWCVSLGVSIRGAVISPVVAPSGDGHMSGSPTCCAADRFSTSNHIKLCRHGLACYLQQLHHSHGTPRPGPLLSSHLCSSPSANAQTRRHQNTDTH